MSISINTAKAQEIWKNRWRAARLAELERLDVEFMRALEAGDVATQERVKAQKQALRDVTKMPLPEDPEQIKAVWPEILPK